MNQSPSKTIFQIIADGLDASVDGRGFGPEHLAAVRLANAAPELLEEAKRNLEWMESIQKHSQFLTSAAAVTRAILQKRIDATRAAIAKAERSANV